MYEIQRRKGRLLTASSLALAAILTAGAGSAWAQGNTTIPDGGTVSGGDASTPITITGATGSKADVNLGGATTTSVLGANGSINTIEVGGGNTLTIAGTGGNLVENTDTKSAINLAIDVGTKVEVTGKGGTVGDITGTGAGTGGSTFDIIGKVGDNMVVNTGSISKVNFKVDPATVNVKGDITDSPIEIDNYSTVNVSGDVVNNTLTLADPSTKVTNNSAFDVAGSLINNVATASASVLADTSSTIKVGGSIENYEYIGADNGSKVTVAGSIGNSITGFMWIEADNGSVIDVAGNINGDPTAILNLLGAYNGSTVTIGGNVVSTDLVADNASTITVGKNVENTIVGSQVSLVADNGSVITVKGDLVDTKGGGFRSFAQNGGEVTIVGKIANLEAAVGTSGITDLGARTNAVTAGMKTLGILDKNGNKIVNWGTTGNVRLNNGLVNTAVSNQLISSLMTINKAYPITDNSSFAVGVASTTATAEFAAGSLLMIDAAPANGGRLDVSASTGTKNAIIDDEASLYIVNAQYGPTTILSGFINGVTDGLGGTNIGWNDNLRFDTRLFDANKSRAWVDNTGSAALVEGFYRGAGEAYADGRISSGTAAMIDGLYTTSNLALRNDVDSKNAGIKFVSRAVNENYLDATSTGRQNNGTKVVTTLEGAASMAATAGVQSSTYSIANTLAGNYNARLSYLNDVAGSAGSGEPGTIGIWINPFYNSTNVDGVRIGRHNAEYDFNYGGGTIGLDSNLTENFRLGLAFSAGGGDTESKGHNFNKTESDFDFWGLGVYGSYTNGMFGLTGDISYSGVSYDIDQRIPGLNMNKLTADVDTDTFTVGLTGEYRYITESNLNIIPHLGLRYLNLKTDSYRVKEKGRGNVFSIGSETQNIWTIPLGVTFTGDLNTSNGWVIQPKADLGVIFATGDLDADSRFRINGTGFGGRLTADDVVDNVTFNGLIGLKAENCDGFSLGLDYNFKASDNLTSHGVTGTIRYDF